MGELEAKVNKDTSHIKYNVKKSKTDHTWRRYCWSCRCCGYWGKFWSNSKVGQKKEATFKDCMNGNTANVLDT